MLFPFSGDDFFPVSPEARFAALRPKSLTDVADLVKLCDDVTSEIQNDASSTGNILSVSWRSDETILLDGSISLSCADRLATSLPTLYSLLCADVISFCDTAVCSPGVFALYFAVHNCHEVLQPLAERYAKEPEPPEVRFPLPPSPQSHFLLLVVTNV